MTSAANAPRITPPTPQTRATAYTVTMFREPTIDSHVFDITIEETAPGRWAVRHLGSCLSNVEQWDYEPISSDRTDEWLNAHRFPFPLAREMAERAAPDIVVNGYRAVDVAAKAKASRLCGLRVPDLSVEDGSRQFECGLAASHGGLHHDTEKGHKWADIQVTWS